MSNASTPVQPPAGRTVRPDTLVVAPEILGRVLAAPWQRLVAMLIDLAVVGGLSFLSKPILGLATGAMLLVLLGNSATAPVALKAARWGCRALGALVIVLAVIGLGHGTVFKSQSFSLDALTGGQKAERTETVFVSANASYGELRQANDTLQRQVEALKKENEAIVEARRSWLTQARGFTGALGVTFGWSGVYFTLVAGALNGRTLGKLLLGLRAVRVSGQPMTFFDAFVRHGGYVAGLAMGLIGFLKVLWEPNRQAVEDRIAGTVVIKGA